MLDFERLLGTMALLQAATPAASLPPDAKACLQCQHHPNHVKFDPVAGGQHCYVFKTLPETLCMQFKEARSRKI